jgi:hypothetical protein
MMMEHVGIFGIIGLLCLLLALIVYALRALLRKLRPIGCLALLAGPALIVAGLKSEPKIVPMVWAGAVCILVSILILWRRRREERGKVRISIEGVEIPAARPKPRFFAKPPAMTHEFFERLCREHLPETGLDLDLLRGCIDRAFVSRGITDWSRAKGDTYFDHATQRQLDFLASMGWPGKRPRYLGEASCFIETALIIKDYNTRKAAYEEKEAGEVAADFTAVWNAATSAGVLAHDDAARLLEIVGRAPKSENGAALVRELERFIGATPVAAECPASLFACASKWLSSFD